MALVTQSTDNRPEAVAFKYGRAWYAGVEANRWGSALFYSQVLIDINRAGRCYQDADPTAEEINSLLDSDGGVIRISDLGKVISLVSLSQVLLVVADNGVWSIRGGSDGFTPLSYFADRITNVGCIAKDSVVVVEDTIMYASQDGIYQISYAENSKALQAQSITAPKIDTYYNDITRGEMVNIKGMYDQKEKVVRFFYGVVANQPTKCLNIRLKNGAWYPWSFVVNDPDLSAEYFLAFPFYSPRSLVKTGTKYFVFTVDGSAVERYAIMEHNDVNFVDFGEAPIDAHMELVGLTLDNPQFDKQVAYMTNYFKPTETAITGTDSDGKPVYDFPSSAFLTPKWEWSNTGVGGKTGRQRQVYNFRNVLADGDGNIEIGSTVVKTRGKLRGEGKAISLRYDAEAGKDMKFLGVSMQVNMDGMY